MSKYLVLPILAVLGYTVLLSFSSLTSSSAETYNHTEEYMKQNDGGDRAEYLQEMEHNDPLFYVPPVNGTSTSSTSDSNILAN